MSRSQPPPGLPSIDDGVEEEEEESKSTSNSTRKSKPAAATNFASPSQPLCNKGEKSSILTYTSVKCRVFSRHAARRRRRRRVLSRMVWVAARESKAARESAAKLAAKKGKFKFKFKF